MYLLQCVTAYIAVQSLMEQECPYRTAHALFMLKKKLQPHVELFSQKERELVEAFAEKDGKGRVVYTEKGTFRFAAGADREAYARRREELAAVVVEEEFPVVKVPFPAAVKPAHLEALEKFIEFEEAAV